MPTIHNLTSRPRPVMLIKRRTINLDPFGSAEVTNEQVSSPHLQELKAAGKVAIKNLRETAPAPTPDTKDTDPAPPSGDGEDGVGTMLPPPSGKGRPTGRRSRRKTTTSRKGD